jgi:hypothetical protein
MPKIPFKLLVVLFLFFFAIGFFLFGFAYDVSCPKCGADGKVPCSYCNGQGKKRHLFGKISQIYIMFGRIAQFVRGPALYLVTYVKEQDASGCFQLPARLSCFYFFTLSPFLDSLVSITLSHPFI